MNKFREYNKFWNIVLYHFEKLLFHIILSPFYNKSIKPDGGAYFPTFRDNNYLGLSQILRKGL